MLAETIKVSDIKFITTWHPSERKKCSFVYYTPKLQERNIDGKEREPDVLRQLVSLV